MSNGDGDNSVYRTLVGKDQGYGTYGYKQRFLEQCRPWEQAWLRKGEHQESWFAYFVGWVQLTIQDALTYGRNERTNELTSPLLQLWDVCVCVFQHQWNPEDKSKHNKSLWLIN